MFGISFGEIAVVALVVLLVMGPQRLPGMLRDLGAWIRKFRVMTTEVREKTGIDDILRDEGIEGGLNELRGMLRGDFRSFMHEPMVRPAQPPPTSPRATVQTVVDPTREYPPDGPDAAGALPDDLVTDDEPA